MKDNIPMNKILIICYRICRIQKKNLSINKHETTILNKIYANNSIVNQVKAMKKI